MKVMARGQVGPEVESATSLTYMDQFLKPTRAAWERVASGVGKKFFHVDLTYNQAQQVATVVDNVLKSGSGGGATRRFDAARQFDGLRRLLSQEEGLLVSGSISSTSREEIWQRDILGFTTRTKLDLNGDKDYADTDEWDDIRGRDSGSERNELKTRDVNANSTVDVTLIYDKNGNLTSDGEKQDYVYNPWCQLVYVKARGSATVIAAYRYNGLGMRISEQTDTNRAAGDGLPDGAVDGYDSVFYIANDLQGRRVATFRGTDTYPKETFLWHPVSVRGPALAGGPLLRDRNKALYANPEKWDGEAAGSVRAERVYYCTDHQGSVVALVGPDGALVEQARYSANGVPFGLPLGDVDADGDCDGADDTLHKAIEATGVYDVRGDLDLDGDVDSADWAIVTAGAGEVLGWGRLSSVRVSRRHGVTALEAVSGSEAWMLDRGIQWHTIGLLSTSCEGTLNESGQPPWIMPSVRVPVDRTNTPQCNALCAAHNDKVAISWCFDGIPTICHCTLQPNHPLNPNTPIARPPSNAEPFARCLHEFEVRNFTMGAVACRPGETGPGAELGAAGMCAKAGNMAMYAACESEIEQCACKDGSDADMAYCRYAACVNAKYRACLASAYAISCHPGVRMSEVLQRLAMKQCEAQKQSKFPLECQQKHRRRR